MSTLTDAPSQVRLNLDSTFLAEQYDAVSDRQFNHGKLLVQDLDVKPGQKILDIGAGTGRLAEYVANIVGPSGKVIAIDPLPLRIDIAKKRLGPKAIALVGKAEDLKDFADASFDRVFYNSVFHWLPEKLGPLKEAARVLKKGGRVGISTATKDKPHQFSEITKKILASGKFPGVGENNLSGTLRVSSDELKDLFQQSGFRTASFQIRTFIDFSQTVEDVFLFSAASSFGNFFGHVAKDQDAALKQALADELEKLRTPEGIRLERHLIFAVAERI